MAIKVRLLLTRLDQVRAVADPLRFRLVEALVARELSVAGLAEEVGAPVTRLYHHITLLLEAGLIEEVRRVKRRGVEERIYRATAREFRMSGSLLDMEAEDGESVEDLIKLGRSVLGTALDELTAGIREGAVRPNTTGKELILQDRTLELSPAGMAALSKELPEFLEEFAKRHKAARGKARYRLVLAAFPVGSKGKDGVG